MNKDLISKGIKYLARAAQGNRVSKYLILATISANHCISPSFEKTDWDEILALYNCLIEIEDTPIVRLNRSVALSKVHGNREAILELEKLRKEPALEKNHLFHATMAQLYGLENEKKKAAKSLRKAISLSKSVRDTKFLQKKLKAVVPI